jgi:hypothetical protein
MSTNKDKAVRKSRSSRQFRKEFFQKTIDMTAGAEGEHRFQEGEQDQQTRYDIGKYFQLYNYCYKKDIGKKEAQLGCELLWRPVDWFVPNRTFSYDPAAEPVNGTITAITKTSQKKIHGQQEGDQPISGEQVSQRQQQNEQRIEPDLVLVDGNMVYRA